MEQNCTVEQIGPGVTILEFHSLTGKIRGKWKKCPDLVKPANFVIMWTSYREPV